MSTAMGGFRRRNPPPTPVPPGGRSEAAQSSSNLEGDRRQTETPLHFRRIELKYVLPERLIEELVERISPYTDWDPFLIQGARTSYPVTSLYFDSFDLQSLFAKEAGWLSRRRIRLRTYHDTFSLGQTMFFEIKRRHDFLVSKDRLPLSVTDGGFDLSSPSTLRTLLAFTREQDRDAREEANVLDAWYSLRPTAMVAYDRIAFVGKGDRDLRITIDRDLKGMWRPPVLLGPLAYRYCGVDPVLSRLMAYDTHFPRGPHPLATTQYVVLELKFAHAIPSWLLQVIRNMNLSRSAYSKYACVVRTLRPNLFEAIEDQ